MWFSPETASQRELQVHAERIKAVYQQATMTSINSWATALLFIFIPNSALTQTALFSWFGALTLSCLLRVAIAQIFKRQHLELKQYHLWGLIYVGAVFSTAVVWASGLVVLVTPDNVEYQLFLMTVLVALCIGASHSSTTYPLLGQAYNVPVMSAYVVSCIVTGGMGFYVLAGLASMFAFMMFVVGRDNEKRFGEILELRFELAQKKDDAENANVAKTKFLAAASHDLRQPLHALTLFTGLLRNEVSGPKVSKIVDSIDASIEGLQDLFNSLLDFSKLDAGTLTVEKEDFQLSRVFSAVENDLRYEAEEKGLSFFVEPCQYIVYTDSTLLGRIVKNLVSNAIRYTQQGSVVVLFKKTDTAVSIEVRDTGVGIPKEHQEEIFEEFTQLHNPERDRTKGLGLGLSIVRGLSDLLELDVSLTSTPGVGTSFFLNVPLGSINEEAVRETSTPSIDKSFSLEGLRVLLIDDEPQIREGTLKLLESWGCNARGYRSEDEALEAISKLDFVPDIVLADYRLENNRTGLQAIKAINDSLGTEVLAAIVTGDTAPDRLKEAEESGHLLLHKPVKPMQLRSYLTRMKTKLAKTSPDATAQNQ